MSHAKSTDAPSWRLELRSGGPADWIALSSFSNNLDTAIHGWPGAENHHSDDCCRWLGVRCRRLGAHGGELRVASLDLAGRGLTGALPSALARLDELRVLNLSGNPLHRAVPPELIHMPRLEVLDQSQNHLTGELGGAEPAPPGASGLVHLDISSNRLTSLRAGVFLGLPRLRRFSAESNQLTGVLPGSLSSCSELEYLNMANNSLHGNLGSSNPNFSRLTRLRALHLGWNRLSGHLPASLSRCRDLRVVNLHPNNLPGPVPSDFRRLQALSFFDIGINRITGIAPALRALQECRALAVLVLTTNFQGEELPGAGAIRGFPSLRLLGIANCALRGAVPPWLRASARLGVLDLSWNRLAGQLQPWLGGFDWLYRMDLSNNALAGEIPPALARLRSLDGSAPVAQVSMSEYGVRLYNWHVERGQLWYNSNIPPSLQLSRNGLAGAIPPELGDLRALNLLNLSWNALSGPIPATLATLSALQTLDLSHNELAGEIPASLEGLTFLSCFDVSHNRLRGMVPAAAQFSTFPCSSFADNPGLNAEYYDGNRLGKAPETDGKYGLTVVSEIFGLPFWLGMIFDLYATMFVHLVVLGCTKEQHKTTTFEHVTGSSAKGIEGDQD
ncbi:phytosulfokine receptor 1-like [Panicum virgatum]|uniref:phytosulfokine receptor 1-like n=1 Tax=Panicum virgatum TaxID=38727 RepID=UPI0019D60172|nr:phytosulfokine receptor 1-like [Panicum virgatum]